MSAAVDLGIPGVVESNAVLQFAKEGGAVAMKIFPINVDVEGPGFVHFYTSMKQNSQQLKPGEFTSVGQIRDKEGIVRSEEHTSELQSRENLVCRLLLEKK